MKILLERLATSFEDHGPIIIGAIMSGEYELVPTYKLKKDND